MLAPLQQFGDDAAVGGVDLFAVGRRQRRQRLGRVGGNIAGGKRRLRVMSVAFRWRMLEAELLLEHVGDIVEERVRIRFVDLDQILALHVPRSRDRRATSTGCRCRDGCRAQ